MKSDPELKQIAIDLFHNKIFSSEHLKNEGDLGRVFIALRMMKPEQLKEFKKKEVCFIYEYLDKVAPRSVNGMPVFFSLKYLNREETQKTFKFYNEYKTQQQEFMGAKR